MEKDIQDRRPIRARETRWAASAARFLRRKGCTPNGISLFSILFAAIAALCFLLVWHSDSTLVQRILLVIAAAGIQGRLICNLLDGMVAVEGGLRSPAGAVYNELPDRISDTLLLLGMGYGLLHFPSGVVLGWACALFAITTAYIRLLGGTCGLTQRFSGPMAKQHRMALLTAGALAAAVVPQWGQHIGLTALIIILAGTVITCIDRTRKIIRDLHAGERS
ncbi:CDP-alcohol phosphatidyltransferase family protein [Trabulsiella odontotermitis]|uniref:CDP-alcohol phosphatidyltransferase family protein n=1 Tax=Trabulsiella odontotermitis TaxID=379893 RepID=UPI003AD14E30